MTDPDVEPWPPSQITLDHRYTPRVCAAPYCALPPHVRWRVASGGYLYGLYRRIGDPVDLCGRHEREAVDLCGADWDDAPVVPRQRTEDVDSASPRDGGREREPSEAPPRPLRADQRPKSGQLAELPGYLQDAGDSWLLRIPCQRCSTWHTVKASGLVAGDQVAFQTTCPGTVDGAGRVVQQQVVQVRVVVQRAKFSWKWERDNRVTSAYLAFPPS